jgi:threonylcarbamoyladenosine tRNA methylthiotransferase MtaB
MIEELPFTYLHVFTYSARPGTPAASMPEQVPVQVARERNRALRELASRKKLEFMRSFIGREIEAITLNQQTHIIPSEGEARVEGPCVSEFSTEALTDNYLKLLLAGRHEANRWVTAHVQAVSHGYLIAS